jgi:ubiquinone/menaquinone biosynthesis C-methylase UbiE
VTLESRDRWVRAAEGWEKQADRFGKASLPVSAAMIEAIAPQPGHTILDLAAGIGDTGYLAAELIKPGGTLITSDFAPEMLAAAQRRAAAKGLDNVRFRQMDMSVPLDQPAASVDGVLCRWGYMLLEDPESALRDTRRILKSGATLALAAWTGPDDNLWSSTTVRILQARGVMERSPPGAGQFAWQDRDVIAEHMQAAGFIEPEIRAVDFVIPYDDVDDWWVAQTHMSVGTALADERMDFATRSDVLADLERAAEPFLQPDDSLKIPAKTWVATATA